MGPLAIFWLLYSFYICSSLWDFFLTWRQYRTYRDNKIRPGNVEEIISEEDFKKARNYKLDKMHFQFFTMAFGRAVMTLVIFCNIIPWTWAISGQCARSLWSNSGEIFQSIMFVCIAECCETLTSLPFSYYDTFYIEQKHGFNKETIPFFFKDRFKKIMLGLALTIPSVAAVIWLVRAGGPYFYIYVWAFISLIVFALTFIYPEFIAPLFDKYTPLPDSELKTKIEELAQSVAFPLTKLYVVEGSKRSSHSNAYMYGFWKNKRIVLYDTLLSKEMNERLKEIHGNEQETQKKNPKSTTSDEQNTAESIETENQDKTNQENATVREKSEKELGMADDEVVAVLGHELGHWKHYHSILQLVIAELNMLLLLFVFGFFYRQERLFAAFGFTASGHPVVIGLFLVSCFVLTPYNELMSVAMSFLSRRCEFDADKFAAKLGFAKQLRSGLIKLSKDNLSLPIDDWLYSACNHSHPPIVERIEALKKFE